MNLRNLSFHNRLAHSHGRLSTLLNHGHAALVRNQVADDGEVIESDIAARLDRLPWDRFHTLVVVALGITWILDGLEVTMVGSLAGALESSPALHLSTFQVGVTGSAYISGAVLGAIFFGWLTDRRRRPKLFFGPTAVYLAA